MWAHNLSPHATLHNILSILYHIKCLQNKIVIQCFLSKPLCPCSHVPRMFFFTMGMLQPSSKKQFKCDLFKKPSKISLNRVCYAFYVYSILHYAKLTHFKNLYYTMHSQVVRTMHLFFAPNTCISGTELFNKCSVIKLSLVSAHSTHILTY